VVAISLARDGFALETTSSLRPFLYFSPLTHQITMRLLSLTFILSIIWLFSFGQSDLPTSLSKDILSREVPIVSMPAVDVETLMAEDEVNNALKVGPYRFGHNMQVNITAQSEGLWEELKDGSRVWRMGFRCEGAFSVNFIFDDFYLPFGAKFHIYNEGGETIYGPFTYSDNREDNGFATFPIPGELVFIELYEPVMAFGQSRISLETVTHGYRDIFRLSESRGGGSGACNNNVNCPVGDPWQDQKRSVAIMVSGGSGFCTGAMVNNTAQDGTPYFLSANHCMGSGTNNWVFKFDYERPGCPNTGGPNAPNTGNFTQGAVIRASNAATDFALLQLNSTPPSAHNVYYAGWNRENVAPTSSVCIHHPQGDRKKITFDNNAAVQATFGGASCWRILNWESGTTEPGSSGSPLFDQNQRVIGQLYGGTANCNNNIDDYYGRFDLSWNGNSSSTRLRDWLDPSNSGVTVLDGFDPNAPTVALDAAVQSIVGVENGATLCDNTVNLSFTLRNRGTDVLTSATINWTLNGVPQTAINWTGSLNFNQTTTINLPQLNLGNGQQTVVVTVTDPNGSVDQNANNDSVSVTFTTVDGQQMSVVIRTDEYPEETSWEIRNAQNQVVASGNGGSAASTLTTIPNCLADGCYTFTIFDSFGDGLCCQWGQGYFELLSPEGAIMGSGAQFTSQMSVQFCLPFLVPEPVANFSVASTTVCTGNAVAFTNTSTPSTGVSYAWTFQGGSPASSSSASPSVSYSNAGTFNVSLTVTNSAGSNTMNMPNYITVNPSPSVSTSSTGENLWAGGANGTATASASGGTAPLTITWSPGNGSGETITGLIAGNYTATVTDANGCTATSTVTVGSNVGINDLTLADAIRTYPNPTEGLLTIELPIDREILHITMIDVTGRAVMQLPAARATRMTIDLSSLAEGVYHLSFYTADARATKKVVVMRQ